MYYKLEVDFARMSEYVNAVQTIEENFLTGEVLDADKIELPYEFTVQRTDDSPLYDYYPHKNLMSDRLVTALLGAGVDNLQLFPCVLVDTETGERLGSYHVVNVIGMVSVADEEASTSEELADVSYFHNLVIDPSRAHDLRLFRLAESRIDVLVHETVAEAIAEAELEGVVLIAIEESDH